MNLKNKDKVLPSGMVEIILTNVKTGKSKTYLRHNLVTTVGKNAIAGALIGMTSGNKGIITYCALGTSAVAPVPENTKLTTEIFRKLVSVRSVTGNVALFETFFTINEANGSLKEAGLFGDDATATKDSGTLFCHLAINRVKTTSDTLTLRWSVTIG